LIGLSDMICHWKLTTNPGILFMK